jgi:hypothetical protein
MNLQLLFKDSDLVAPEAVVKFVIIQLSAEQIPARLPDSP